MAQRTIKLFLDSNVIISGIISDKGPPRVILDLMCLHLVFLKGGTGQYNLMEIERNLKKILPAALDVYLAYLPVMDLEIVPLPSQSEIKKYSGMIADKDLPVLASAILSRADYLVTGDKKDFGRIKGITTQPMKIVSPAECLMIIGEIYHGHHQTTKE
jgi:predicted nucleic acid-binding protein